MSKSVFCTASVAQTETIMQQLKNSGFSGNDISVLMADKSGTRDFAHEHNTKAPTLRLCLESDLQDSVQSSKESSQVFQIEGHRGK